MNFLIKLSLIGLALSQITSPCILVCSEEILNLNTFALYVFGKVVLQLQNSVLEHIR
jgi:hypothetical protein